jgi:hypothetical protein
MLRIGLNVIYSYELRVSRKEVADVEAKAAQENTRTHWKTGIYVATYQNKQFEEKCCSNSDLRVVQLGKGFLWISL